MIYTVVMTKVKSPDDRQVLDMFRTSSKGEAQQVAERWRASAWRGVRDGWLIVRVVTW